MAITKGIVEILQIANSYGPKSFNDFTKIPAKRGGLSSATVSKRLDELIALKAIEEVITKSISGRRVIAYITTKKVER